MPTLGFLAQLVNGELHGDAEYVVHGPAPVDEAGPEHITFAADERALAQARAGAAGAVIVSKDAPDIGRPVIRVDNPRDRKSTRLNSSHVKISYAVFCLKK